jgi:hypothetical protein
VADENTIRDVIHAFNERGLAPVDPRWAGGRPRLISDEDIALIGATAKIRPGKLGRPFTHTSPKIHETRRAADRPAAGQVSVVVAGVGLR